MLVPECQITRFCVCPEQGCSKENSLPAKIFIELVTTFFYLGDLEQNFCLQSLNALNARLPSFMFTRGRTQYTEREHIKQVL